MGCTNTAFGKYGQVSGSTQPDAHRRGKLLELAHADGVGTYTEGGSRCDPRGSSLEDENQGSSYSVHRSQRLGKQTLTTATPVY
jgi:hypothetical protein